MFYLYQSILALRAGVLLSTSYTFASTLLDVWTVEMPILSILNISPYKMLCYWLIYRGPK